MRKSVDPNLKVIWHIAIMLFNYSFIRLNTQFYDKELPKFIKLATKNKRLEVK
jgi:hypothetical protein